MNVQVLIADDSMVARLLLERVLHDMEGFTLAASFSSAKEAVSYCRCRKVDLVIMDMMEKQHVNSLEAAVQIKEAQPWVKIVLGTSYPEISFPEKAREAGADSFCYKEAMEMPLEELLRRTVEGESVFPKKALIVRLGNTESDKLTPKELEVLREMTGGYTNQETAESLNIGVQTVKTHITNMLQKTGMRNRLELAMQARVIGLVICEEKRKGFWD